MPGVMDKEIVNHALSLACEERRRGTTTRRRRERKRKRNKEEEREYTRVFEIYLLQD